MSRLVHAVTGLLCILALPATLVLAQDACPVDFVCVEYEDNTIALDPAAGPVQAVVVQERSVTLTDFSGSSQRNQATLAVYISDGDTYVLADEVMVEREGRFADAELGTFYDLAEAE